MFVIMLPVLLASWRYCNIEQGNIANAIRFESPCYTQQIIAMLKNQSNHRKYQDIFDK